MGLVSGSIRNALEPAEQLGRRLWREAVVRVQQGDLDDRPLYWQRLAARRLFPADEEASALELASRNQDVRFEAGAEFNVLVTGFDPFDLDEHIDQSNPSGVVALSLDGRVVGAGRAEIRTMIMPVRFRDFDEGIIEWALTPLLEDIHLLVTVSMGRDAFDLERFPGRQRSSGKPDNCRQLCGGTPEKPIVPPGSDGPEFVEFSLPVTAMFEQEGDYPVRDNRRVTTIEAGDVTADSLAQLSGYSAVQGSGGGYLSNEISYRAIRLVQDSGRNIPVGHIHTPRIAGSDVSKVRSISRQTAQLIQVAIESLPAAQSDPVI